MFDKFPKQRISLPPEYLSIYNDHIKNNREGNTTATSVSMKLERWLHKKTASDLNNKKNISTLEIGAGTLNQLSIEDTSPYDIVEPMAQLYQSSPHLYKLRNIFKDINEIHDEFCYERITSVATFEHITNLPEVVAKTCCLLKEGGSLRVAIPNEGTILWKLGTTFFTGIEFRLRHKLSYALLMSYEHVNTADEIEEILKYFYKDISCSVYGLNKKLAFYRFYECKNPVIEHARSFIK